MSNLESLLGFLPDWETEVLVHLPDQQTRNALGYVAVWEAQSQLATLVLVALVALASVWLAFVTMLAWSMVATVAYYHARKRGLPDLLERSKVQPDAAKRTLTTLIRGTLLGGIKLWLVGIQPFLFSRTLCRVLGPSSSRWHIRLARPTVLLMGLTLFGVTTCHHMLRTAGYSDKTVIRLSFLGSLLNVSYRVLVGAVFIDAVSRIPGLL